MKRIVLQYPGTLSLIWALVIFVLCATPGRYIPSASWLDLLSVDKLVHAAIFFTLCSLLFLHGIKNSRGNDFLSLCFSGSVLYGCLLEFMQARYFIERSADWQDIVANSAGCLIALFFINKFKSWYGW